MNNIKGLYKQPDWQVTISLLGFMGIFGIIIGTVPPDITSTSMAWEIATCIIGFFGLCGVAGVLATWEAKAQIKLLGNQIKRIDKGSSRRPLKTIAVICACVCLVLLPLGFILPNHLCIVGTLVLVLYTIAFYFFDKDVEPYYEDLETMRKVIKRDNYGT